MTYAIYRQVQKVKIEELFLGKVTLTLVCLPTYINFLKGDLKHITLVILKFGISSSCFNNAVCIAKKNVAHFVFKNFGLCECTSARFYLAEMS